MTDTQRPGVFSSYEVTSTISGSGRGGAVGIVAQVPEGSEAHIRKIDSYASAVSAFGAECSLTKLVKVLLLNGASSIVASPVEAETGISDYSEAFERLKADETVRLIMCDSHSAEVHAAMKQSILSAPEMSKYCIGIVETDLETVAGMATASAALNCERMVLVPSENSSGTGGAVAAAFAGIISAGQDPALPFNGAELIGLSEFERSFSNAEITWLVEGGVTPVENSMGSVYVVRGITTRSISEGVFDVTWRELTTVLILDDVISAIRGSLRSKFSRTKNTAQTRGAIRTQVLIELENKKIREIIDDYGDVVVEASPSDPTVCDVSFEFAVAHGLNQIRLMAHITV